MCKQELILINIQQKWKVKIQHTVNKFNVHLYVCKIFVLLNSNFFEVIIQTRIRVLPDFKILRMS